jgi:opine dehydrogenase
LSSGKAKKWAVIGAGNGGQTAAGHLAMMGCEVTLYDVSQKTIDDISALGGITLHGALEGFGKIAFASTDIAKVMDGAEVVMIVLPSMYVESIAKKCAPHIRDGQVILLHPGSTFAPIEFQRVLERENCRANYLLGGTSTLIYATRIVKNGSVKVLGLKEVVSGAALPANRNDSLQKAIQDIYPQIRYIKNTIEVGLENLNAIVHPGPAILNTSKIDGGEDFQYYIDGFTPQVAAFAEKIDEERVRIGKALNLDILNVNDCYIKEYPTLKGGNLYEIIRSNKAYEGLSAPKDIYNRYLLEDIPYTLVPMSAMGNFAGVKTPGIDAVITIGYMLAGDKMDEGRTGERMGLDRFASLKDLFDYVDGK